MLPATHRLNRGAELRRAVREGRRGSSRSLVVHLVVDDGGPARAGFVVSRAVGNAVVRNRVRRRLRELCRERLELLPPGAALVVRALAPAARATYQELGDELDRCLRRALEPRPGTVS